jgi:hypothetical protein
MLLAWPDPLLPRKDLIKPLTNSCRYIFGRQKRQILTIDQVMMRQRNQTNLQASCSHGHGNNKFNNEPYGKHMYLKFIANKTYLGKFVTKKLKICKR